MLDLRLSHQDLRRVLDSIGILNSDEDPATLPSRTNDSVRYLVSADVVSFEAFGTANDYQGPLWYTPANSVSNQLLQVIAEHVTEQPFWNEVIGQRKGEARTISDYLPLEKYKKTKIYNEFFHHINTDRQMVTALNVAPELMVSCSLCRLGTEFSGRDCGVFDLLAPHLVSAFRAARIIKRLETESESLQLAIESTKFGIIVLDSELNTIIESVTATALLAEYFEIGAQALPERLLRFVQHYKKLFKSGEYYLPPKTLTVAGPKGNIGIQLSYYPNKCSFVLLLKQHQYAPSVPGQMSKITSRQFEVLRWISFGKTNLEIGEILEISPRTVQKHIENIFDLLGVDNRTAAMAVYLKNCPP
jgi:DNA-binding CsgD family transcriptional regulator